MVGFNRRFSKYAREIKKHVVNRINPLFIHYRMNAGYSSMDSWVHSEEGGGRIIGEACHIIDLFSCLIGTPVRSVRAGSLQPKTESVSASDNKSIILEYEDGSVATLEYFAMGSREYPKEFMEVHFDEKTIVVDDYKFIKGYGIDINELSDKDSEKGHLEELETVHDWLIPGEKELNINDGPIKLRDIFQTTKISIEIQQVG